MSIRSYAASMACTTLTLLFSAAAHSQAITFFEIEGFGGRQVSLDQSVADFEPVGMNDRANAVIVRYGQWQLCTDAYFRGHCVTLSPGEYPNLGSMDMRNAVSSARMLDGGPAQTYPAPQVVPQPLPPPERYTRPPREAPAVVLYDQYDFSGSSAPVSGSVDNLDVTSWNDRAVSMVINYGNWELCTDANFRGACQVYGPGSYRDLGNDMVRRLSSLRPAVGAYSQPQPPSAYIPAPPIPPPAYAPPYSPPPAAYSPPPGAYIPAPGIAPAPQSYASGRSARAILYDNHDFSGGSMIIDVDMPNLDRTGFNDRASSIRIEGGYWLFCSDADYQGDCRTFGPGDYPNLPDGFERRISSVRRVNR